MLKKKLKELHMANSSREGETNNNVINQHQQIKKVNILSNERHFDNFSKRNLPELKLSKFKSRLASEADTESKEDTRKINNVKKPKSRSLIKKKEVVFPQIGKNRPNDIISSNAKQGKHNIHNPKLTNNTNNNIVNIHKIKPNIPINKQHNLKANKNKSFLNKQESGLQSYHPYIPSSSKEKEKETDLEMKELDFMTEKLNMLHNLFNSLNSLTGMGTPSPFDSVFKPKPVVALSSEVLSKEYQHFTESTVSQIDEFSNNDLIKAYAYNSSQGNVRDYNEDTIQATKVNNQFHFFAVYDGHGGNGCSIYLRDNLHLFIKEFSSEGLRNAITNAEDDFIKTKAMTPNGELGDGSGSCGIMAIIQGKRCIIANVGDSRCVVFKKEKVDFATVDHKPSTEEEKERITKAGGKIYQTPTIFPLFQNGQEISGPWRVLPGRLSVSRTFGDVEAKEEKFGGMKNVVVALPDITEIELSEEYNFIVIGCDGIFDVLSNEDLMECAKIAVKEKKGYTMNHLCGEIAGNIIKASLAKDSFDNVSCVVIAVNLDNL